MTGLTALRLADRLTIRHLWMLPPLVALAIRAVTEIGDNSFLWHVRAGEVQLSAGEVLRSDPFSYTELGAPWRTQSWLLELVYGWLFLRTGGLQWVPTMIFLIMSGTFAFLGLAVYRWVRDPVRTAVVLRVMTWVAFFLRRPPWCCRTRNGLGGPWFRSCGCGQRSTARGSSAGAWSSSKRYGGGRGASWSSE